MSTTSGNVYRIGVDVGGERVVLLRSAPTQCHGLSGTNTDSVLLCLNPELSSRPDHGVLASYKHPTTPVVSDGIEAAVRAILTESLVPPADVASVMIGSKEVFDNVIMGSQILSSDAFYE